LGVRIPPGARNSKIDVEVRIVNLATLKAARAAVERGVRWLDEFEPDWWKYIALDYFDINDAENCVLGQTFWPRMYIELGPDEDRDWYAVLQYVFGRSSTAPPPEFQAKELGFESLGYFAPKNLYALERLWQRVIRGRQERSVAALVMS
jgi:hypothetical protein